MQFKLLLVFVEDSKTEAVIEAARAAGATGCTVINHARGEGVESHRSFLGLSLTTQRDVVMLLVERHLSRHILERMGTVGEFDSKPGTGMAIQIDVEDAIGVIHQAEEIVEKVEEQL